MQEAVGGGALRALQSLIQQRDPSFGGLERVQDRTGKYLWVHPKFVKIYRPDPPIIP